MTDATAVRNPVLGRLRNRLNELTLFGALLVLATVLALQTDKFLSLNNLVNICREASFIAIIALGMTLVIVAADIDLSVGQAAAFSSVLLGVLVTRHGWPLYLGCLAVVAVVSGAGMAVGSLRARFNVPSFITTLAMFSLYDGLKQTLSNNTPIPIRDTGFGRWGGEELWGLPIVVWIMLILLVVFHVLATRTAFGRSVYAVGGNAAAARLAGLPVRRIRIILFGITGALAALTGLLLTSRLGTATGAVAGGMEFSVIAAVVIGGTALSGGRGTMLGTLLGCLFMATIQNGLVLLGVNSTAQNAVRGVVIIVAVLANVILSGRESDTA